MFFWVRGLRLILGLWSSRFSTSTQVSIIQMIPTEIHSFSNFDQKMIRAQKKPWDEEIDAISKSQR
jgi:hypothetical protein